MSRSRDFVGDYNNIRMILRDMFFYGCYTVDDFEKRGISASKFNQEKRKLLGFLQPNYIKNQRIGKKSAIHFKTDMFDIAYNFLFDTYMMKSFVESEAEIYLLTLQVLSASGMELTQNEIADRLSEIVDELDKTTLYRLLRKLEENGYLKINKDRTPFTYRIAGDLTEALDPEEFLALMNAVDLLRNIVYPSICGNLLFDTLNRIRKISGLCEYHNPFLLKHSHYGQVLDDEVLWELMNAIADSHSVSFDYQQKEVRGLLPVRIVIDEAYGRRYLFAVDPENEDKPGLYRLDKIDHLSEGGAVAVDRDRLRQIYDQQLRYSVTGATLLNDRIPVKVSLLCKNEVAESVSRQLKESETRSLNEEEFIAELYVNDPSELKPFLRRMTGKITVIESSEHTLAQELEKELADWRLLYEDI